MSAFLVYWRDLRVRKNRDWILNPIVMFIFGFGAGILFNWFK
jgi:hypothetical protein